MCLFKCYAHYLFEIWNIFGFNAVPQYPFTKYFLDVCTMSLKPQLYTSCLLYSTNCISLPFTLARSEGIRDVYICKTQVNVQSLIDVQSSNPCPIPSSQTSVPQIYVLFHILKLAPNDQMKYS